MSFEKIVEAGSRVLATLEKVRWSTLAKLVLLAAFVGTCYVAYETRAALTKPFMPAGRLGSGRLQNPASEKTQAAARELALQFDLVGAVQLVNANFPNNTRDVVYTYADDDTLRYELTEYYKNKIRSVPLFLLDERDALAVPTNMRMVNIINGVSSCHNYENTLAVRNLPRLKGRVAMLCSVSIPPYFGYFSGYLTLWLTRLPTPNETDELRAAARTLAADIYDREFLR